MYNKKINTIRTINTVLNSRRKISIRNTTDPDNRDVPTLEE